MIATRRSILIAAAGAALVAPARAAVRPTVRVGTLRFGSVAWELDVVRAHGFDAAAGIAIEAVDFAAAQATQVALQAGRVDLVVLDWLWVARQRASGADWTCSPTSAAVGAIVAPESSPVRELGDLPGKRLGIAGSPLDKSWLILRAYARQRLGFDLDNRVDKSFGSPPLLAQELAAGRLDAALTYWPYAAKAEAAGMRRVLGMEDAVESLGIPPGVPFVGSVFSEAWAGRNRVGVDGFLSATRLARDVLAVSDDEWRRIAPLTAATDDAELDRLKVWYRRGLVPRWGETEQRGAARLFEVLAGIGGEALVGPAVTLPPGTFWPVS